MFWHENANAQLNAGFNSAGLLGIVLVDLYFG
jgi:hypothetical protein